MCTRLYLDCAIEVYCHPPLFHQSKATSISEVASVLDRAELSIIQTKSIIGIESHYNMILSTVLIEND